MGKSTAGEVALKAAKDNPGLPSRTLARQLRREHPKLYRNIDAARNYVRTARGNHGKAKRRYSSDRSAFRPNGAAGEIVLPPGLTQCKPPLKIKGPFKALVMGDLHIPYHDVRAIKAALITAEKQQCDTLYLNGDTIDFYSISRWEKDPRQRNLKREVMTTRAVLESLGKYYDRKYFKRGNHDDRWDAYLWSRAEDMADFEEFELGAVLRLEDSGYIEIRSKQWAELGKLSILHGHEVQGGYSVNPARGLWNKLTSTAACNHHHQSSHHSDNHAMTKTMVSTWSLGCMCDLHPAFAPLNKWNLGFGICEVDAKGGFNFNNYKIDPTSYEVFRA